MSKHLHSVKSQRSTTFNRSKKLAIYYPESGCSYKNKDQFTQFISSGNEQLLLWWENVGVGVGKGKWEEGIGVGRGNGVGRGGRGSGGEWGVG